MAITVNRVVLAHRLFTGISRRHLVRLFEELAVPWQAGLKGRRHAARGGARKRAAGAGACHQLVFVDRLVATLTHLRHDLPHSVLGLLFGVDRSTITRAIAEVRTLLAERGCAVPDHPDLRLRTLTDAFAHAQAEGIELRLDATEIQVRRPPAGRDTVRINGWPGTRVTRNDAPHDIAHPRSAHRPPATTTLHQRRRDAALRAAQQRPRAGYWDSLPWTEPPRAQRFIATCRTIEEEGTGARVAVDRVSDGMFIG
ncbi:transposase family protein [Streptomyces sp. NPDC088348]|uniref:helix-turn-helix domain-containing protein n=1 Tax=Streptomyces sp. NPDC088348 TaxID=3365853 RepID=UPI0038081A44